ncbi:MAG TPA: hypothetical protein V6C97_31100 [Oculatellaceae cyanobacterium]
MIRLFKSWRRLFIAGLLLNTAALCCPSGQQATAGDTTEKTVTLKFPADHSIGKLCRLELSNASGPTKTKTAVIEAQGDVKVPASWKLLLTPSYAGAEHLDLLQKLGSDSIYSLDVANNENFSDNAMEQVSHVASIRVLKLDDSEVSDKGMQYITRMPQLLSLSCQQLILSSKGVAPLRSLKNLERLRLDYIRLQEQDLQLVSTLTNLKYLSMNHCNLEDSSMKYLKNLKKLCVLQINNNRKISDQGIEYLSTLSDIRQLDIEFTGATPNCVASLKKFPRLTDLSVGFTAQARVDAQKQLPHCDITKQKAPRIPLEVFAPLK